MALLMLVCRLLVSVLCLPLQLMEAVGLYRIYKSYVFPFFLHRMSLVYNKKMYDKKQELFRSLSDFNKPGAGQLTLLEIGTGTGANFEFYPAGCKVICTDPNPHFDNYLKKNMSSNDHLQFERFVVATGEDLGSVGDESVDVVVCTLVLCSVRSIPQTLREAYRVLRPVSVHHMSCVCVYFTCTVYCIWYLHVMMRASYLD